MFLFSNIPTFQSSNVLVMTNLAPLIRVRKHAIEQKQKLLAELYRQAEQLADNKRRLLDQLAEEQAALKNTDSVEMIRSLAVYAEAVKGRVADIDAAMKRLDARIEVAREDMREAFAELKKIEITAERRADEIRAEFDKKESDMLDEMGIDAYRRKIEEE